MTRRRRTSKAKAKRRFGRRAFLTGAGVAACGLAGSDAKLASALEQQGFAVARRTVAKYRESLGIAPASERKNLD